MGGDRWRAKLFKLFKLDHATPARCVLLPVYIVGGAEVLRVRNVSVDDNRAFMLPSRETAAEKYTVSTCSVVSCPKRGHVRNRVIVALWSIEWGSRKISLRASSTCQTKGRY